MSQLCPVVSVVFQKTKKKAGTCLQPCSMHLLCLVHVGPKHGSPNVISMLSSYTVTFPWFLVGTKFLAKFDEGKGSQGIPGN